MAAVEARADSGKLMDAAITRNPYVATARFVIAGNDVERNVKHSVAQIAQQTARYLAQAKTAAR